jgi:hypothetical protein
MTPSPRANPLTNGCGAACPASACLRVQGLTGRAPAQARRIHPRRRQGGRAGKAPRRFQETITRPSPPPASTRTSPTPARKLGLLNYFQNIAGDPAPSRALSRACAISPTSTGSKRPACSARRRCPKNSAAHSASGTMTKTRRSTRTKMRARKGTWASDCLRSKGRLSRNGTPRSRRHWRLMRIRRSGSLGVNMAGVPIRLSTSMSEIWCGCGEKCWG